MADMSRMPRSFVAAILLLTATGAGHTGAFAGASAEDPCAGFTWNVSRERTLFSGRPEEVKSGVDPASAPLLSTDHLYDLELAPQAQIHYPVAPAKAPSDGAFGGLAHLRVVTPGLYRVSLDEPFWVDVESGGQVIQAADHQGRHGCKAPHKVVQFSLPAKQDLTIELSGTYGSHARITITRAPGAS
jgi:hypothetical protein